MGVLLENAAAAALHALVEQYGHRLFHWRERNKHEVDLVLDDPVGPLAFEIGSSIRHSRSWLAALMDRHPRFRGGCYLVTPDSPRVVAPEPGSGIGALPLDMFLLACGRQAAEGGSVGVCRPEVGACSCGCVGSGSHRGHVDQFQRDPVRVAERDQRAGRGRVEVAHRVVGHIQ